jgi:hypothetical protein
LGEFRTRFERQEEEASLLWSEVSENWRKLKGNQDLELGYTNSHIGILQVVTKDPI